MIRALRARILHEFAATHTIRRIAACLVVGCLAPVLFGSSNFAAASQPEKRPMSVEDLWAMDRVGAPAVSPDGRFVVSPVTRYSMEDNDSERHLWIVAADGSSAARQLTSGKGNDGSPAFSPDGRRIAFVSTRDEGPAQLWVMALDGGEAQRVTDLPIAPVDPKWLPDGSGLAFLAGTWPDLDDDMDAIRKRLDARREDKVGAHVTENRILRYWDHYTTDGRVPHVFHVPVPADPGASVTATDDVTDLTPGSSRLMDFDSWTGHWDIAPDGREIVLSANTTEPPYQTLDFNLWTIPLTIEDGRLQGGEWTERTAANPGHDVRPRYSLNGDFIVYGRTVRVEVEPEFTRLSRYDRDTGATRDLYAGSTYSPSGWEIGPDDTVLFHAQQRGRTNLYSISTEGGSPALVDTGGVTSDVAVGHTGTGARLVFRKESIQSPPELWTVSTDGSRPTAITRFNDARLALLDLGTVEDATFRGYDDQPVQMWIVYPPGFSPRLDWPLLQVIHGGPHGASQDRWHTRWNLALFASTGAVVTAVNFHGSTGFGQAFAESILGNHADKPFTDIQLATDYMLGRGYIDRDRLVASGGSYGGYLVAWILGHTDRFAALINHAGVYDLLAQFGSDWTYGRSRNYGAAPWEDPDRISRYSPSRYAPAFATPTLILHGEKDYRVPAHHGINLHGVLTAKGVRSRLVLFPDENHFILSPHGSRLWWGEVFSWLREYAGTR